MEKALKSKNRKLRYGLKNYLSGLASSRKVLLEGDDFEVKKKF